MENEDKKKALRYLSIAFLEGATVMAAELLGAKMTAPFFGTTIYSWAAVLAVTLGALATGYYFGGWLSYRKSPDTLLKIILPATGVLMAFMPSLANVVMKALIDLNLLTGLILSLMVFLFPLVFLFGMVSPVIVSALSYDAKGSGKTAGRVYAISTLGGVINTLLLGFYLIPAFGIKWPAVTYGLLMLAAVLLLLPFKKKALSIALAAFVALVAVQGQKEPVLRAGKSPIHIIYSSEGLLGQVKVADYAMSTPQFGILPVRGLLVNNTWQTVVNKDDGVGLLDYIYFFRPLLSDFPKGSKVLLIGLGGGTLCSEIQAKGLQVEAVELDPRLSMLAKKYFGLPRNTRVINDDGRHYLQTTTQRYDLIIFDAFLGENPPWHLLTREAFQEVQKLLKPGGRLMIEFYGFLKGDMGKAGRSVYATLLHAGFEKVDVVATSHTDGIERNFIFVAGSSMPDYASLNYSGVKYSNKDISHLEDYLLSPATMSGEDTQILTDDLPALETMLMKPALQWRKELNHYFRNRLVALGQPIFY